MVGGTVSLTGQFEITPELTSMGIHGASGRAALYINDRPAGAGEIAKTVPFGWSLSGEGLCCGFDSETPVSELYASPYRFTGGLARVVVSVSGQPYENVALQVRQAFLRQ